MFSSCSFSAALSAFSASTSAPLPSRTFWASARAAAFSAAAAARKAKEEAEAKARGWRLEVLPLADGSTITALEVQWELLDLAKEYVDRHGTDATGGEATHEVLRRRHRSYEQLERVAHAQD